MVFKMVITSIPDLNKKLNIFLFTYISLLVIILAFLLTFFFNSYAKKTYQISENSIRNKLSKFISSYEYQAISIASQPLLRNLLEADNKTIEIADTHSNSYYRLRRQIAVLIAKYKPDAIFEGIQVINRYTQTVFTQGSTSSTYKISIQLCYRDSILSYNKGNPCLGTWTFYISESKFIKNLLKNHIKISKIEKNNIPIDDLFSFEVMQVSQKTLPKIFFQLETPYIYIKYLISAVIALLFLSMIFLVRFILNIYKKNYFNYILQIHNHLTWNKFIPDEKYRESPSEISDLLHAVNKALAQKKIEAIENLAHDLNPPLKRLQEISYKVTDNHKQDIIKIHTQFYLAIKKLHEKKLENIDIKKSLFYCILSIYTEQFNHGIITLSSVGEYIFCRGSYSHFVRIISNIIENALKATLSIPSPKIIINLSIEKFMVKIDIQDNGEGISLQNIEKIFVDGESFTGSSGKGLSFCKRVIESWLGSITCVSRKNEGTNFCVQIPQSRAPFDYLNTVFYLKNTKFIIIDDEPQFHKIIINLIPQKQTLIHLHNLRQVKNFLATPFSRDAIFIIDYQFSECMNGIDIIKKYNLFGQAYMVSSSADYVKELYPEYRGSIPMISKGYINKVKFQLLKQIDAILVDDDTEILADATAIADIKSISLLALNNFLQLKMILHLLEKTTPITLDNHIDDILETGLEVGEKLYKDGFRELYLQSGEKMKRSRFFKKIFDKGDFFHE